MPLGLVRLDFLGDEPGATNIRSSVNERAVAVAEHEGLVLWIEGLGTRRCAVGVKGELFHPGFSLL